MSIVHRKNKNRPNGNTSGKRRQLLQAGLGLGLAAVADYY